MLSKDTWRRGEPQAKLDFVRRFAARHHRDRRPRQRCAAMRIQSYPGPLRRGDHAPTGTAAAPACGRPRPNHVMKPCIRGEAAAIVEIAITWRGNSPSRLTSGH